MKTDVNFYTFCNGFSGSRENNFSREGKQALYDYLLEYEEETEEEIDFDPVALCCDFTEYNNFDEFKKDYPDINNIEELEEQTDVIRIEGTDRFIIQAF